MLLLLLLLLVMHNINFADDEALKFHVNVKLNVIVKDKLSVNKYCSI